MHQPPTVLYGNAGVGGNSPQMDKEVSSPQTEEAS